MVQTTPPADTPGTYQPEWSPWVRQLVTVTLVIAAVYALTLLAPVTSVLITTFLLSFLIFVPARSLAERTALNYPLAVLVIFAIILTCIVVLMIVLVPSVIDLVRNVVSGLADRVNDFQASLRAWDPAQGAYTIPVLGLFNLDITSLAAPIRDVLVAPDQATAQQAAQEAILNNIPAINPGQVVSAVTQVAAALIGTVSQFFSTVFLSLFLSLLILLDLPNYQQHILRSAPAPYQRELRLLGVKITRVWQGFFRGQLLLVVIIGALTFAQLIVMGVPGALPLSLIVAAISLIPSIGGILALIPLAIVPLLQGSSVLREMNNASFALLVVGVNLVISQVIWNGVAPKIMGNAVSLPLPMIIVGIIIGAAVGGVLGAFLIVPILGTIRVLVFYLVAKVSRRDPFPGEEMPVIVELTEV